VKVGAARIPRLYEGDDHRPYMAPDQHSWTYHNVFLHARDVPRAYGISTVTGAPISVVIRALTGYGAVHFGGRAEGTTRWLWPDWSAVRGMWSERGLREVVASGGGHYWYYERDLWRSLMPRKVCRVCGKKFGLHTGRVCRAPGCDCLCSESCHAIASPPCWLCGHSLGCPAARPDCRPRCDQPPPRLSRAEERRFYGLHASLSDGACSRCHAIAMAKVRRELRRVRDDREAIGVLRDRVNEMRRNVGERKRSSSPQPTQRVETWTSMRSKLGRSHFSGSRQQPIS
jgi:hypothetical protein